MGISNVLPQVLLNSKVWSALFKVTDEVISDPVDERIEKLAKRFNIDWADKRQTGFDNRQIDETDENRIHLFSLAKTLGYNLKDRGKLPLSTFARFIEETVAFIPYNGTAHFLNFFSYLLDNKVQIDVLWYDEANEQFYAEDAAEIEGKRFGEDGFTDGVHTAYPTPYVRLVFSQGAIRDLGYTLGELQDLFYSIAPADILIHEILVDVGIPTAVIRIGAENTLITAREIIIESSDTGPIFVF